MYRLNSFFYYSFILLLFSIFIFGGFFQYFLGVPSTLYTLIITIIIFLLIIINILVTRKVLFKRVLFICLLYFSIVLFSGLINKTSINKIILYCIFPMIPFGVFYLYKIIETRNIILRPFFISFFRFVAIIQLPFILIQKYGYDFLITLNNSNQNIHDYDFMFGTFFIRADHSLGFFILMYIINIIFRIKNNKNKKIPWILLSYLTLTIFIMESNLTKVMLLLVFSYYLFIWLYIKFKIIGMIVMVFMGGIIFNIALSVPSINAQYSYFQKKYNPNESLIAYKKKYAKRPQIVITYATHLPVKWIGEGPYDYYNIFENKFKQTQHFSQLIWTYNDLGLIGFIVIIVLTWSFVKSLLIDYQSFLLIFGLLMFYLFLTNVFSDLAMIFSLLLLLTNNKKTSINRR